MDILCNIIRCTQPPLSEPLLNSVFPVVVNTILASDDNSVLQVQSGVPGSKFLVQLLLEKWKTCSVFLSSVLSQMPRSDWLRYSLSIL